MVSVPADVVAAVERGWSVIPCRINKKPSLTEWKPYQERRATLQEVEQWARSKRPASWAVITGSLSGIVVLDFDGEPGRQLKQAYELRHNVVTPRGGAHVYVEHPGHKVTTRTGKNDRALAEAFPNLDIRGDGGYAIFSGTNDAGPGDYRLLDAAALTPDDVPRDLRPWLGLDAGVPLLGRDNGSPPTPDKLLSRALAQAIPGGRNAAGFDLACQLRDNGHDRGVAEQTMVEYAGRVPEGDHAYTEEEALASVKQAYSRSAREPWGGGDPRPVDQAPVDRAAGSPAPDPWVEDDDEDEDEDAASTGSTSTGSTSVYDADYLNRVFFNPVGLRLEGARRIGERSSHWLIDLRNTKTGELHERINLGRTCDLRHQQIRDAILEATGLMLRRKGFAAVRWDRFTVALHAAAVLERTGGDDEETREWLSDFIAARNMDDDVDMDDKPALAKVLDHKRECFVGSNGCLYIRLPELVKYVTHICAARTTNRDLAMRLYGLGFQREQVSARITEVESPKKCRYFRSRPGFNADA